LLRAARQSPPLLFVLLHGARLLPEVMAATRIAWAFTALLVPVVGVVLYLAAYRRPRLDPDEKMAKWLRPPAIQAAAATAMGFGYGAPLMVAVGWTFAYYGFPLFFGEWADGWWFLFGAGMPLMMIGMYVGAVLLAWPFVQTGMMAMMKQASHREVMWRALGVTALSMAAVSLGMMTTSWFMMMERHPMMMPHEDEILWFISLWLASTVGFYIAWRLNWPMVRTHLKPGTM
jgi:MFS family permease